MSTINLGGSLSSVLLSIKPYPEVPRSEIPTIKDPLHGVTMLKPGGALYFRALEQTSCAEICQWIARQFGYPSNSVFLLYKGALVAPATRLDDIALDDNPIEDRGFDAWPKYLPDELRWTKAPYHQGKPLHVTPSELLRRYHAMKAENARHAKKEAGCCAGCCVM